jgi:hypothetical protein
MSKDVTMVLQPAEKVVPMEDRGLQTPVQKPVKIFCAERPVAMALLEDFILMAGAQNDVSTGKATPDQIQKLAVNTHTFLVELGDHLMIDCGLNEKDIEMITKKISAQFKEAAQKKITP